MNKYRRFCSVCKLYNTLDLFTPHEKPGKRAYEDFCDRCIGVREMVLVKE